MATDFEWSQTRGFLPLRDPLQKLHPYFRPWEDCAQALPDLIPAGGARGAIRELPLLSADGLRESEWERAMLLLSFLGHAYVWGADEPENRIPQSIAVPWYAVSQRIGRPPVLSYASYALYNWRRLNLSKPVDLGNIALLQHFLGGMDESWFILVHVAIEGRASSALFSIVMAQEVIKKSDSELVEQYLSYIARALEVMYLTLLKMPERCDPYIYYHRVRPYIHGWKDHPALPNGVIYEGVEEYGGKPKQFRGETGAQSSIIPTLDAALGIEHGDDPLRPYLAEMREYMPPEHRAFIEAIEGGPSIRQYVIKHRHKQPALRDAYNACVDWVWKFRTTHLELAGRYIHQQSQQGLYNPTSVGTGGTPFMPYLKKHRDETKAHKIP